MPNLRQGPMKSEEIDGKYIIVHYKKTQEAVGMFKFDYDLHQDLVHNAYMSWNVSKYRYTKARDSEAQTFMRMGILECDRQERFYVSTFPGGRGTKPPAS